MAKSRAGRIVISMLLVSCLGAVGLWVVMPPKSALAYGKNDADQMYEYIEELDQIIYEYQNDPYSPNFNPNYYDYLHGYAHSRHTDYSQWLATLCAFNYTYVSHLSSGDQSLVSGTYMPASVSALSSADSIASGLSSTWSSYLAYMFLADSYYNATPTPDYHNAFLNYDNAYTELQNYYGTIVNVASYVQTSSTNLGYVHNIVIDYNFPGSPHGP